MNNTKYCRVSGCRYAWSHLTSEHMCGRCQMTGHGRKECGKNHLITRLTNQSINDRLPVNLQCRVTDCRYPLTHQSSAHICSICGNLGHGSANHPPPPSPPPSPPPQEEEEEEEEAEGEERSVLVLTCPICRKINHLLSNQTRVTGVDNRCVICWDNTSDVFLPSCGHVCLCHGCSQRLGVTVGDSTEDMDIGTLERGSQEARVPPRGSWGGSAPPFDEARRLMGQRDDAVYLILPAGMGCSWYLRRNNRNQPIESFFMHSDDWGQYGPTTNRTPQLNAFTNGYQLI